MHLDNRARLQFMVGGLLYTPANSEDLAEKLQTDAFKDLTSIAFCLEDAIHDDALEEAEQELCHTFQTIKQHLKPACKLPLIFVRIRTPEHMAHMHELLHPYYDILTGYILPKFDLSNCDKYKQIITAINQNRKTPIYIMPILESSMIADISSRTAILLSLKVMVDSMKDYVLNIRVGGNDFCNLYGFRRNVDQSIYQIGVVRDILMDIMNVFGRDYVVSGPVWEYFGSDVTEPWAIGLQNELALDRLNGFVGKTSIHPSQIPLIYNSLKVSRSDYEDACRILGWSSSTLGVEKSADGTRMNEVKCHSKWARKIITLGEIYGIIDN